MKLVAFTGHRPGEFESADQIEKVVAAMQREIIRLKATRIISGMALGVDTWAAQLAISNGLFLTCAVPFQGQESIWPEADQKEYRRILHTADVCYVSPPPYSAAKMQRRNEWMVDRCDVLVAVWNGNEGGTMNTVIYAEKVGREIVRIDPREL